MKRNLTFRQKLVLGIVFGFAQGALLAFETWCAQQIEEIEAGQR